MRIVARMIAASLASWAVVAALVDPRSRIATLAGMTGPLAVAGVSWVMAERVWRRSPEDLTRLMISAFGGKMVFFGAYVIVMLAGLSLEPVPFVASFTAYFIALHVIEALSLKRLVGFGG
ncbi:MAG TPA: hypothetical protein VI391_01860 [Thermoanaerobaculia bacterium]